MEFKDYYQLLQVSEKATADEIKKAYKKLARKYHPDVSKEKDAEKKFKEVAEAYEVLKDPAKRQEYDQIKAMGASGRQGNFRPSPGWNADTQFEGGNGTADFSEFFESLFGRTGGGYRNQAGGQQFRQRGEDVQAELPLLLEEAYHGCEQLLQLRVPEVDAHGQLSYRSKQLKIKVPPGTAAGTVLRIKGQGAPGIGDAGPGDLLVTIKLAEHPLFSVDGRNLTLVVPVLPWEAALGCKITVPGLKSRSRVIIPPGSQSGQKLRLAGLGLPGNPPGDFFVVIKIVMPEKISDKAKELFRELQQEVTANPRADWEDKP